MGYQEEEMLMLSGIQHYMFCPRQWALIHIEQQWSDNRLTVEGDLLHTHVDDPFYRQKNGAVITLRSVSIASSQLGLYGLSDAIELHATDKDENTIGHPNYAGRWMPYPIEYKRGHSKPDERDEVQLMAQAICLEELYGITIDQGALYYGETKRRESILFSPALRQLTLTCAEEMHRLYEERQTPKAEFKTCCRNCSLINLCLPKLDRCTSVNHYLEKNLYEETT